MMQMAAERRGLRSKEAALKAFLKQINANKIGDDFDIHSEMLPLIYDQLVPFLKAEDAKYSEIFGYKLIYDPSKFEDCDTPEKVQKMELFIAKCFFHDNIVEVEQQLVAIKSKHYRATWSFRRIPAKECAFCKKIGDNFVYDEVMVGMARYAYDMAITICGAPINTEQFEKEHCVVMVHIFNTIMKTTVVTADESCKVLTLEEWITSIKYIGKKTKGFSARIAGARPPIKLATTPIPLQQTEPLTLHVTPAQRVRLLAVMAELGN